MSHDASAEQNAGPVIAVGPGDSGDESEFEAAVVRGGAEVGPIDSASALIWTDSRRPVPDLPDSVKWVQLPFAGVETFIDSGVLQRYPDVTFTSAAGAYAGTVAEHALALLLAGVRGLWGLQTPPTTPRWDHAAAASRTHRLGGSTVAIIGAGAIGRLLAPELAALGAKVIAVNRSGSDVTDAVVYPADRVDEVWPLADHLILAAPATAATRALVDESVLAALKPHSWIVNVGRGSLVDTDALVRALRAGTIGGAALDVTDPEPLADGHPLWSIDTAIITPHVANPQQHLLPALLERVEVNVRRFANGMTPLAVIDRARGY